MTWNKKNQQFALSCGLRPSSKELAQWILRKTNNFQATEKLIDLKVFNQYIGESRVREYDPKTVKEAIAQLDESTYGWFKIQRSHNWHLHTVLIRPVEIAISEKSRPSGSAPKLKQGNPMFSDAHKERLVKQQQQDISKLDTITRAIDLKFSRDNLLRIWRMANKSWSEVTTAVEYLLHANSTQKTPIGNAHGFLVDSFKYGWHKGFNLYYQATLPIFESASAISNFVAQIIKPDLIKCQI